MRSAASVVADWSTTAGVSPRAWEAARGGPAQPKLQERCLADGVGENRIHVGSSIPLTKRIIFVSFDYKGLYRNSREPTNMMGFGG